MAQEAGGAHLERTAGHAPSGRGTQERVERLPSPPHEVARMMVLLLMRKELLMTSSNLSHLADPIHPQETSGTAAREVWAAGAVHRPTGAVNGGLWRSRMCTRTPAHGMIGLVLPGCGTHWVQRKGMLCTSAFGASKLRTLYAPMLLQKGISDKHECSRMPLCAQATTPRHCSCAAGRQRALILSFNRKGRNE